MRQRILRRLRETIEAMESLLCNYVEVLRERLPRSAIVLFGSRARGNHMPYSDFDLMVIVENEHGIGRAFKAAIESKPRALPVDLIILSLDDLSDPLRVKMLKDGCIILHDGVNLSSRLPCKTRICG